MFSFICRSPKCLRVPFAAFLFYVRTVVSWFLVSFGFQRLRTTVNGFLQNREAFGFANVDDVLDELERGASPKKPDSWHREYQPTPSSPTSPSTSSVPRSSTDTPEAGVSRREFTRVHFFPPSTSVASQGSQASEDTFGPWMDDELYASSALRGSTDGSMNNAFHSVSTSHRAYPNLIHLEPDSPVYPQSTTADRDFVNRRQDSFDLNPLESHPDGDLGGARGETPGANQSRIAPFKPLEAYVPKTHGDDEVVLLFDDIVSDDVDKSRPADNHGRKRSISARLEPLMESPFTERPLEEPCSTKAHSGTPLPQPPSIKPTFAKLPSAKSSFTKLPFVEPPSTRPPSIEASFTKTTFSEPPSSEPLLMELSPTKPSSVKFFSTKTPSTKLPFMEPPPLIEPNFTPPPSPKRVLAKPSSVASIGPSSVEPSSVNPPQTALPKLPFAETPLSEPFPTKISSVESSFAKGPPEKGFPEEPSSVEIFSTKPFPAEPTSMASVEPTHVQPPSATPLESPCTKEPLLPSVGSSFTKPPPAEPTSGGQAPTESSPEKPSVEKLPPPVTPGPRPAELPIPEAPLPEPCSTEIPSVESSKKPVTKLSPTELPPAEYSPGEPSAVELSSTVLPSMGLSMAEPTPKERTPKERSPTEHLLTNQPFTERPATEPFATEPLSLEISLGEPPSTRPPSIKPSEPPSREPPSMEAPPMTTHPTGPSSAQHLSLELPSTKHHHAELSSVEPHPLGTGRRSRATSAASQLSASTVFEDAMSHFSEDDDDDDATDIFPATPAEEQDSPAAAESKANEALTSPTVEALSPSVRPRPFLTVFAFFGVVLSYLVF